MTIVRARTVASAMTTNAAVQASEPVRLCCTEKRAM
jgi:hypothetical protein